MEFALSLKETVEQYGLMAKKSLGQNFHLSSTLSMRLDIVNVNIRKIALVKTSLGGDSEVFNNGE